MRTPKQATAWLRRQAKSRTTEFSQKCKLLARTASGIPSDGTPTAKAAWAKTRHRGTGPASKAPEGAKIWWTQGSAGHVVTSNGKGGGIGNYYKDGGRVRELTLATWNSSMGGPPVGWSYDIDGELAVPLPKKAAAKKPAKPRAKVAIEQVPHKVPPPPPPKPDLNLIGHMERAAAPVAELVEDLAADVEETLPMKAAEPLLTRAAIVGIVGLVVSVLAAFGIFIPDDLQNRVVDILVLLLPLPALIVAWWARRHVTPVADPRADDGTPLVRLLRPDV